MEFKINARSESATKTTVQASGFTITIDEPAELGGTNAAPNPVEMMLAALAGCVNVMGHVAAGELGMPLKGIDISITGELNPAKLFGEPTNDRAGFKSINIKISPDSDASADVLAQWLSKMNDRSPVLDNLLHATPVSLSL